MSKWPEFEVWQASVERELQRLTGGFGIEDLPDWRYWDDWSERRTPEQTAKRAFKNAREF